MTRALNPSKSLSSWYSMKAPRIPLSFIWISSTIRYFIFSKSCLSIKLTCKDVVCWQLVNKVDNEAFVEFWEYIELVPCTVTIWKVSLTWIKLWISILLIFKLILRRSLRSCWREERRLLRTWVYIVPLICLVLISGLIVVFQFRDWLRCAMGCFWLYLLVLQRSQHYVMHILADNLWEPADLRGCDN